MTSRLHALLVGINQYPDAAHRLDGCINDVARMERYLRARTAGERYELHLTVLRDEQATRRAVVEAFQRLGPALAEDVVLFYFSGHGSQEWTPPELRPYEPDGLDETLVCWDSRTPGGWDLADKELAHLIAQAGTNGAHVVVILDCCHSGSGTRSPLQITKERRIPVDARPRPFASYLFAHQDGSANLDGAAVAPVAGESGWHGPPDVPHVLLAACRAGETAKESYADGAPCGVFTHFLLATLETAGEATTYQDLFKQTQALVLSHADAQTPQFEALASDELRRPFLGGAVRAALPYFTLRHDRTQGWVIDGGAVHGLRAPAGNETTTLAVYPADVEPEAMRQAAARLGTARVADVQSHQSSVTLEIETLDTALTYKATVIGLPLPALAVALEGDPAGCELVRRAILSHTPGGTPSLYVREVCHSPHLRVLAAAGEYVIARPQDERALVREITGYTDGHAHQVVERLEHIARWTQTADLSNPASGIPSHAIDINIVWDGRVLPSGNIRLAYKQEDGRWAQPQFRVRLQNRWSEPLYCALVTLSESYAVSTGLLASVVRLAPGEQVDSRLLYGRVPAELWEQGITERRDIVKAIASTSEFDPTLLVQPALDAPRTRGDREVPASAGTLERHIHRLQAREAEGRLGDAPVDDWATSQLAYTVVRPRR